MTLSNAGLQLLRQWEGCRLQAYPDPGSGGAPWTIGYGHTGPEVQPGLCISQAQADHWLQVDVQAAEAAVDRLLAGCRLSPWQREALVSFCFNVGPAALEASTLRRRLQAGGNPSEVLAEELPRWCKGPAGPVEGLRRRRAAELQHATTGPGSVASSTATTTPPGPTAAAVALAVPYCSQNDSRTAQGARMCFSSTCAMAAAFVRPGCLGTGLAMDDRYLELVQRHGDTTDPLAQVAALRELGVAARFRQDGTLALLEQQLRRGLPVPVGWLHHGPVSAPSGGGHWSLVIGWDPAPRQLLLHDPNGEADLVHGGYVSTAVDRGRSQRYSERNWCPRWLVEGPATGWWLELQPQP